MLDVVFQRTRFLLLTSSFFVQTRCSETGTAVQLHVRRTDVVLGARVVFARVRRRRGAAVRVGSVRRGGRGRRRADGRERRRRRAGRRGRRVRAADVGQHDRGPAGLHAPVALAVRRAPVGRVRVQLARHQRAHVADRLHAELGRQTDHVRYVTATFERGGERFRYQRTIDTVETNTSISVNSSTDLKPAYRSSNLRMIGGIELLG